MWKKAKDPPIQDLTGIIKYKNIFLAKNILYESMHRPGTWHEQP